jgi:hypothetical protein
MSVTDEAWATYGKWCEEHRLRCPDCEHDAVVMTDLFAEFSEGQRPLLDGERVTLHRFSMGEERHTSYTQCLMESAVSCEKTVRARFHPEQKIEHVTAIIPAQKEEK